MSGILLRLPQESVVRSLEDLALLGDRAYDRLERGALVGRSEGAGFDFGYNGCDAAADGAEILEALLP